MSGILSVCCTVEWNSEHLLMQVYAQLFPPVQYVTCNEVKQVQLRGAVYLMNEYYL